MEQLTIAHLVFEPKVQSLALKNWLAGGESQSQDGSSRRSTDPVKAMDDGDAPNLLHGSEQTNKNLSQWAIEE